MEIDKDLARAARQNLRSHVNVIVNCRSGAKPPLPSSDIIYVNAGSTAPLRVWLDALRPEGRLVFPLTPGSGRGAMLRVTGFQAAWLQISYAMPISSRASVRKCLSRNDAWRERTPKVPCATFASLLRLLS
jgi:protein-L-isoaspartate O-methyltransferase